MYSTGKRFFIALSMLIILFTVIGGLVGKVVKKDDVYRDLTNFSEVLTLVERSYVESVNLEDVFTGALEGLADSLAPDACYLTAVEYEKYSQPLSGDDGHIGVDVSKRLGYFIVIAPWDNSSAARAGLLAGDIIKSINGIPSEKFNTFQAEEIFRGKTPEVTLELYREGLRKTLTFTVGKEKYAPPPPEARKLEDAEGLAYLRISSLDGAAPAEIGEALKAVQAMEASGLLLDLRNLSGDDLEKTVAIADLFLEEGTIVTLKSRKYPEKIFRAGKDTYHALPTLYIMVNRGTAGCGEVLAASLAENGLGKLVGEKSFGRGTIKEFLRLKDGSAIFMPVSKYITPERNEINTDGLDPHWKVERSDLLMDPEAVTSKELLELELEKILEYIAKQEEEQEAA